VHTAIRSTLRCTAAVLSFALLFQQFAHAATPSRKLLALQQSTSQQQTAPAPQQPAPIERAPQTSPAGSVLSPEAIARQRLLAAHTLYVAKGTQDANFPASPDEAYNDVLSRLRAWGRFQLVDSVASADLVLQLHDAVATDANPGTPPDYTDASITYEPSFQLTLADPATLAPLWVISVPVAAGLKHRGRTNLLSVSAENLVTQLKLLAGDPLTAQDVTAMKQVRTYRRLGTGVTLAFIAVGVAVPLALLFVFKHHAQQDQAAFCQAHNISPCPGA
jgi:hypothetical protein